MSPFGHYEMPNQTPSSGPLSSRDSLWPLANRFAFRRGTALVFIGADDEIVVTNHVRATLAVLQHCTGYLPLSVVRSLVPKITDDVFLGIIETGLEHGFIQDSRKLYLDFHRNSTRFGHEYDPVRIKALLEEDRRL